MARLWRIYYGDETTFSDDDGAPGQAPSFDVQAIIAPHETVGRLLLCRWDWYYWHEPTKSWWGSDLFGLQDQLLKRPCEVAHIMAGRHAPSDLYDAILDRARNDPDFPVKSAELREETPGL